MSTGPTNKSAELPRAMGGLEAEYEILRELGRGGTAVVYLARDRQLGRDVAIKVIRSTYVEDEEAVARLLREARTVAQLQHPNIVMLYGTRRLDDGSLALIMQYVPGRPLKTVIRAEGPLPFKMATAILDDVSSALAYAHRQRIVHRDIKPENIYLDEIVEVARLADFGIARHWDKDAGITLPGMAIGTPTYMSPEQIDGADLDGRSDIYSLGIVGYEMLTGKQPWAGENLYSIIYKQKNENLPRLEDLRPGLPPGLGLAIRGALHKRPEDRWESPDHFLAALRGGDPASVPVAASLSKNADDAAEDGTGEAVVLRGGEETTEAAPGVDDHALTIKYQRPTEEELVAAVDDALLSKPGDEEDDSDVDWVATEDAVEAQPSRRKWWAGALLSVAAAAVTFILLRDGGVPVSGATGGDMTPPETVVTQRDPSTQDPSAQDPGSGMTGGDSSDPVLTASLPAEFRSPGPTALEGEAGRPLADPVRIQALNASGEPAENALVEFVVTAGGGRTEPRFASAGPDGFVEARWVLGTEPGGDRLMVHAPGLPDGPTAEFTASRSGEVPQVGIGLETPPASDPGPSTEVTPTLVLAVAGGGDQEAAPGSVLPSPVRVIVQDGEGQPLEGARVFFRPTAGGSVDAVSVTTDAEGMAATSWTLGGAEGLQSLTVEVEGAPGVSTSLDARAVRAASPSLRPTSVLAAGGTHTCALSSAGVVTCWGGNSDGQLGDGSRTRRSSPQSLAGGAPFARLAAGFSTTCGLTQDGDVRCWGRNDRGQIGDGTTSSRSSPTPIAGTVTFRSLALGFAHACGLAEGGRAFCWGGNDSGQLGTGTGNDASEPTAVAGGRNFRMLSVGWNHTCGISGSQTFCWGSNSNGQLGTGAAAPASRPTPVALSFALREVSAGGTHTCGTAESGIAYCWGANGFGQLGDGENSDQRTPVLVSGDLTFRTVSAGPGHTCGVTPAGDAYCWGRNNYGQLGDGTTVNRSVPTKVAADVPFARITANGGHTCGRSTNGVLYCWGYNSDGQLGDGTRVNRSVPTRVR